MSIHAEAHSGIILPMKTFRIVIAWIVIGIVLFVVSALAVKVFGADLMTPSGTTSPHPLIFQVPLAATRFQLRSRPAFSSAPYQNVGEIMTDLDARCVTLHGRQVKICRTPTDVSRTAWHELWLYGATGAAFGRVVESNRIECPASGCVVLTGSVP